MPETHSVRKKVDAFKNLDERPVVTYEKGSHILILIHLRGILENMEHAIRLTPPPPPPPPPFPAKKYDTTIAPLPLLLYYLKEMSK